MRVLIKILIILTGIVILISSYWVLAQYTSFINDSFIAKGKWGNISGNIRATNSLITGLISILILIATLKYYSFVIKIVEPRKSLIFGVLSSLLFILLATILWADSWIHGRAYDIDAREAGDYLWKLGHPLTFLVIEIPMYIRYHFQQFNKLWSDFWAYPTVLILFIAQFTIYVHGVRMIANIQKIRNAHNKRASAMRGQVVRKSDGSLNMNTSGKYKIK